MTTRVISNTQMGAEARGTSRYRLFWRKRDVFLLDALKQSKRSPKFSVLDGISNNAGQDCRCSPGVGTVEFSTPDCPR